MLILLLTVMARTVIKKYVSHGFDLTISFSIEKNPTNNKNLHDAYDIFLPKRTKCIIISTFVIQ